MRLLQASRSESSTPNSANNIGVSQSLQQSTSSSTAVSQASASSYCQRHALMEPHPTLVAETNVSSRFVAKPVASRSENRDVATSVSGSIGMGAPASVCTNMNTVTHADSTIVHPTV